MESKLTSVAERGQRREPEAGKVISKSFCTEENEEREDQTRLKSIVLSTHWVSECGKVWYKENHHCFEMNEILTAWNVQKNRRVDVVAEREASKFSSEDGDVGGCRVHGASRT